LPPGIGHLKYRKEITMKKSIGGLFETQENANRAYEALQTAGFGEQDIHMFIRKPRDRTAHATEVSIQDIARNAFVGGLIGGAIGGFLGFLVGVGAISLPYLETGSVPREPLFVIMSVVWGLVTGGLTGLILGVASRLLRSREKAEVMTRQIDKRGVLVTVKAKDFQNEKIARRVMEQHNAVEVGPSQEKWDLRMWVSPNENAPSPANPR
jgi:hypothetical protein